jgi:predicted ester cyclase
MGQSIASSNPQDRWIGFTLRLIKMMDGLHDLLPDIHVSIEDFLAEDDRVMVRNICTGTNLKGETIQFKGFVLWRLKDGKIVERWATVTPPKPVESETPIW